MNIEYENLSKVNAPFAESFRERFNEVLSSGWFILGKHVNEFETAFAEYNKVSYCSGTASGLDALTISLLALDMPAGSEVIVPSNTYIATILSILQAGHNPILVEPDIRTYNINPLEIKKALTRNTRAIMVVHLYGKSCDMDPILAICRENNLYLIEDCAQSHGAEYRGNKTGSFGDLAAFSFYPTKNLGCLGDGGAILTNNIQLNEKVKILRNYGSSRKYYNEVVGVNSRLDEIQAAFLSEKLKFLDDINNHKRKLARIYFDGLKSDYILPCVDSLFKDVYHIFNIRHEKRDAIKDYLKNKGIQSEIHYPIPPNKQKALNFLAKHSYPLSEEIHSTTLSLPISFSHTENEIYEVVEALNKF